MEFISEIRDIDDDAFVSLEEIELLNVDTKKLMLRVNNNKLTAYRFLFMGVKIIDRTLTAYYDSTLPEDFKDLPLSEKTIFIRPFKNVQYESAVLRMGKIEPIIIDPDLDIVEYKSVVDGVEIIYRLYSRYEFENRTKLNFDIFPVPTKLEKLTVTSENEVYFRQSDIEAIMQEPKQPEASIREQPEPKSNPRFQFHMEIISDQVGRWQKEFKLELSGAFLCKMNLQRDFKDVNSTENEKRKKQHKTPIPQLKYAIVLLSDSFPIQFHTARHRVEYSLFDDDFVNAYIQPPPENWRYEWDIAPVSSAEELPGCVEFNNKVPLLDAAEPVAISTPDVQNGIIQDVKFLRDVIKESIKAEMEAGRVDKMPAEPETSGAIAGHVEAKEKRKAGTAKAQLEAKDRSTKAAVLVTQWITESDFQPGNVTKPIVQNYLGENGFGYADSKLFRDVWKAIPYTMKSSGGRPPGK